MAQSKFDLKQHVTDIIIQEIEKGTPPWQCPWTGSVKQFALPVRHNGIPYRGINVLVLWTQAHLEGYASEHWMTYRQAQELGGQVRKGEKSTPSAFYGTFERKDDETAHDDEVRARIPFLKTNRVFNVEQIDGLPQNYYVEPVPPVNLGTEPDQRLEDFFDATGISRRTSPLPRAYYDMRLDEIHMPPIETFHEAARYYAILSHECGHASGHSSRLDRLTTTMDRKERAYEELVAELTAAMLGVHLKIPAHFDQNAAYIEGWVAAMREDNGVIFKAAADAQRAFDFLVGEATFLAKEGQKNTIPH